MAFATLQYFSRALGKAAACNVIFPDDPAVPRPWSVLYLLHGLSDDHTTWSRRSSIERYVESLPLVVVMPDGGRGWFTNAAVGPKYEDDLIQDVVGLVDRTFPVRAERAGRAIGGLSMGGYGAVKLGLKYPDRFGSIHSHSGAVGLLRNGEALVRFGPELSRIFGENPRGGPEDPFALAERINHRRIPPMRLDCGSGDFLLGQNRAFHAHVDSLQIQHEYEEFPGGHDWAYWDEHVRQAVAFHARTLNLETTPNP